MNRNYSIVIGASITGLAAAKVLSETFSHVLVLEQDDPPSPDKPRRYIPQGAHLHMLQHGGVMAAKKIFPGFAEDMYQSGIAPVELTKNTSIFLHGVWVTPVSSSSDVYPQTRPHLEHYFYNKVKEVKNIEIRHHTRVRELLWDVNHQAVLGVILTTGEQIRADLVVDASGRGSRLPIWLEEAGYQKPHTDTIHLDLKYASRLFHRREGSTPPHGFHLEQDIPKRSYRGAIILPTGNDRWFITLTGYHGDHPSSDPEEYEAFAKSLPTGKIIRAIESLEPEGEIVSYHFKEAIWHRFDKLTRHPLGILAMGDSVCSLDPKFGSGMSKALQEVSVFQELLRTPISLAKFPYQFYKKAVPFIDSAWGAGAGEDFLFAQTTGDKPKNLKLMQRYFDWVVKSSSYDPRVSMALFQVLILARRATAVLAPYIILRVLFDHFIREKSRLQGVGRP